MGGIRGPAETGLPEVQGCCKYQRHNLTRMVRTGLGGGPGWGNPARFLEKHKSSGIVGRREFEILELVTKMQTEMRVVVKMAGFAVVTI